MTLTASSKSTLTVVLLGNPNTGKSTLFQALAGIRQRVGNYPGVTVEKKLGRMELDGRAIDLVDLPGTYSLAPRSPDEMVSVDVLLGRQTDVSGPDVILCIVDASNLERNLYLVSQVLEFGRPLVVALNMMDVADQDGVTIDADLLSQRLGVPVIPTQAHRGEGLKELKGALAEAAEGDPAPVPRILPADFQDEVDRLGDALDGEASSGRSAAGERPRYLVERLILDQGGYLETRLEKSARDAVAASRTRLAERQVPIPAIEAMSRYAWINDRLDGVVARHEERRVSWSDRLDRLLTHRIWGTLIFALLMMIVFQTIFAWAAPLMDAIDWIFGGLAEVVLERLPAGALRSLIVDGVIAGVGGVLVFLPQIFLLFLFIAILEDCGYMARAAFLMDRLMTRVGLSGKSFIPLLSSFACAVPGIMATRVIENRRDRLATILIAPLMSCSARLPVYALLIAAFIPSREWLGGWFGLQGLTLFAMYLVGIVAAIPMAWLLKRTLLRGETPPFVMELPRYKWPQWRTVLFRMFDRGWAFVRRAGTLIVAVAILVWAASYFPRGDAVAERVEREVAAETAALRADLAAAAPGSDAARQLESQLDELQESYDRRLAGAYLRQSYLGRVGRAIEPAVRPLGWDWRIGCAAIASFPAREVVIGALGVLYNVGADEDETSVALQDKLRAARWPESGRPVFNIPVALSLMVFFALCAQCAATLAIMARETNSWRWPLLSFFSMTAMAYVAALITYQVGMLIAGG